MKLGGFTLQKGKKKALKASAGFTDGTLSSLQTPQRVYVTDFEPIAPVALKKDGKQPLIIPLLAPNAWPKPGETSNPTPEMGMSADEQAAAYIMAETQAKASAHSSQQALVIPIEREQKRMKLFHDSQTRLPKSEKRPILQQNIVLGLDKIQDVADKYRYDVASRPEALDVRSDVYESVPVEAFGAALLRGMGWVGDVDSDDMGTKPQPRHKLLGLGAAKRPTLPGEAKQKRKKRKLEEPKDQHADTKRTRSTERDQRQSRSRSNRRDRRRSRDQRRSETREYGRDGRQDGHRRRH